VLLWDVGSRSRGTALALLIPFLLFSLVPFNSREFYPVIGSEAFGIYNRQSCQLLYLIVAAALFVRNRSALLAILALTLSAMFFLKITGFIAGGLRLCLRGRARAAANCAGHNSRVPCASRPRGAQ
jgi:hypothetical protein